MNLVCTSYSLFLARVLERFNPQREKREHQNVYGFRGEEKANNPSRNNGANPCRILTDGATLKLEKSKHGRSDG